jgi:hypothetical protein
VEATKNPFEATESKSARWRGINAFVTVGFALALLAVLLLQMFVVGIRFNVPGYDGSVYYGTSVLLLRGLIPYHSYVLLQPPGIAVLLTPFAALGRMTSTATGFEAARIFVFLVSAVNILLLGFLLRWRSTWSLCVAVALACFWRDSLIAESSVLLEPFLVLATLVAFVFVFRHEGFHKSTISWLGAGVALGLGTSIKIWGVLVFVVLLVPAVHFGRRVAGYYLLGYAVSLSVVSLPFFLLAPSQFIHEVVIDQAARSASGSIGVVARVANLVDFSNFEGRHRTDPRFMVAAVVGITTFVVLLSILRRLATPGNRGRLERANITDLEVTSFVMVLILLAAFVSARQYYSHYGAFAVPFIAILISSVTVRVLEVPSLRTIAGLFVIAFVLILSVSVVRQVIIGRQQPKVTDALAKVIPANACTLSWNPAPLVLSNRLSAGNPSCPVVLDIYGSEIYLTGGYGESKVDAANSVVQHQLLSWMDHSRFVVFTSPVRSNPDLGSTARRYLSTHFVGLHRLDDLYIFRRVVPNP